MPDDLQQQQQQPGETPIEPNGQQPQPGSGSGGTPAPFNFETWLAQQSDEIKNGYTDHTRGLQSALDKERKANKKRDDEAAAAKKKQDEAELSELQKAQARVTELEKANQDLQAAQRATAARETLRTAAGAQKIEFASPTAEVDALGFALQLATFDDAGAVTNAADVWKQIVKERDYLIKRVTPPPGDTNAGAHGSSSKPVLTDAQKREFAAVYGVNPNYIP